MKILFLDIDGVANSAGTKQRFEGFIGIDPKMAKRVQDIILQTDCEVVLSSTWRYDETTRNHVRENVCNFIDITQRLPGTRGNEIQVWLNDHPEVERYAILDDDYDFYDYQPLFQTSWSMGLTEAMAAKIVRYLNDGIRI